MERFLSEFPTRSRRRVLTSNDGIEVSIPNIIVAITISIAVIASVVLGVIWVVPWAQDNAAKGQLQTIQSAEQLLFADANTYGDKTTLTTPVGNKQYLLDSDSHYVVTGDKTSYCAGIYSDSGNVFWVSSKSAKVTTTPPAGVTCPAAPTASS
jgi:type II secretory pathway pseudopilin PulG